MQLATSVPDEAQGLLGQLFGTRLQVAAPEGTDWVLSLDGVDTGRFSSVRTGLPAHLQYAVGGRGEEEDFVIVAVSGGRVAFDRQQPGRRGRRVDRYLPGDVYVGNQPQALSTARTEHVLARSITPAPAGGGGGRGARRFALAGRAGSRVRPRCRSSRP